MGKAAITWLCSDLARVALASILTVGTFALLLTNHPVPDVLWALDGAAIGWYFGGSVPRP